MSWSLPPGKGTIWFYMMQASLLVLPFTFRNLFFFISFTYSRMECTMTTNKTCFALTNEHLIRSVGCQSRCILLYGEAVAI